MRERENKWKGGKKKRNESKNNSLLDYLKLNKNKIYFTDTIKMILKLSINLTFRFHRRPIGW